MFDESFTRGSSRAVRLLAANLASLVALVLMTPLPLRADVTWVLSASQTGNWSVAANWGGALPTNNVNAYIINGGTAAITPSTSTATCNYLYLGDPNSTNSGTIQMSGGSLSVLLNEYVGNNGSGTFSQSGGTNNIGLGDGYLYLGSDPGSSGSYILSGSGLLGAYSEYVGYSGTGTFAQSAGTNSYTNSVYLGYNPGSSGSYSLSGSGLLGPYSYSMYVGYSGTGTFNQSGGTCNLSVNDNLYLGYNPASSGSYNLSGGLLNGNACVGNFGAGTFNQSGGRYSGGVTIGNYAGSIGSYNLSGSGFLTPASDVIVGNYGMGTFSQSGGGNNLGYSDLELGVNLGSSGSYSLSGSGSINAYAEFVGCSGSGAFAQSGGANFGDYVYLGCNPASSGSYTLSGSGMLSASECIGEFGAGAFTQSGATNSGNVTLGVNIGSSGCYSLSGSGVLSSSIEYVGLSGTGTFTQSGGTNNLLGASGNGLYLGYTRQFQRRLQPQRVWSARRVQRIRGILRLRHVHADERVELGGLPRYRQPGPIPIRRRNAPNHRSWPRQPGRFRRNPEHRPADRHRQCDRRSLAGHPRQHRLHGIEHRSQLVITPAGGLQSGDFVRQLHEQGPDA